MLNQLVVMILLFGSIYETRARALRRPQVLPPLDVLRAEGIPLKQFIHVAAKVNGVMIPSQQSWNVTADSFQPGNEPINSFDGNRDTFWHTEWDPLSAELPHTITIDMQSTYMVDGCTYLPRQDGGSNGNIGQHQIFTSLDGTTWTMVAFGTFFDDATMKSASWESRSTRYVRIVAITEAGNRGPWTSAAVIDIYRAPLDIGARIAQTGWTVSTNSFQPGNEPIKASDGDTDTLWHTRWSPSAALLPHTITINMQNTYMVDGCTYLPRQDGTANGNIGQHQMFTSIDGIAWTMVASGTFNDDASMKAASWEAGAARYVRIVAITEAGNRGPWTSAAEIDIYQAAMANGARIAQTDWTASADSFEPGNEPIKAFDGNRDTFWHTKWSAPAARLPHTITIDMKSNYIVQGCTYLPRQDGNLNGNIGRYQIFTSLDGTTFDMVASGAFVDDATQKTLNWQMGPARYVQIKVLSEAGNRGPWMSAAEINIYRSESSALPSELGKWGPTINFPIVPVAAALKPDGSVLTWASYAFDTFTGGSVSETVTSIYYPTTGVVTQRVISNTQHDMFCPGISMDFNGRSIVTGGNSAAKTSIYEPFADVWIPGSDMTIARGYQSSATCSDGRIFTIGGSWSGGEGGKNGEVYNTSSNTWSLLSGCPVAPMLTVDKQGVYRADNHAWLFGWKSGYVFQAGPSKAMNWYSTSGSGGWSSAGTRDTDGNAMCGNAVMYDAVDGKILTMGGSPDYTGATATTNAFIITLKNSGIRPTVKKVSNMANRRIFADAVVLPDGKVFVTGGQTVGNPFSDANAIFTPELWDPVTETFQSLCQNSVPRTYHSIALLLPDATVLSGGGGLCGTCSTNHFDAQIYIPRYLLTETGALATRPKITSAPASATLGSNVTILSDSICMSMSLIRMGSTTHTVNTDQRRIPLSFTSSTNLTYTFTIPSDPGVVLPGYWMLFVMDIAGVPSKAMIMKLT